MVNLATPDFKDACPSCMLPFKLANTTNPVTVPDDDETFAVKVTGFPWTEGFGDEVSVVSVFVPTV